MTGFFYRLFVTSVTVFLVPYVVSGVHVGGVGSAAAMATVLVLFNYFLRPLLIIITFPVTVLSLGLFLLFINAFLFQLAASFISGFKVDNFSAAFFASLVVSFVSWFFGISAGENKRRFSWQIHKVDKKGGLNVRDLN